MALRKEYVGKGQNRNILEDKNMHIHNSSPKRDPLEEMTLIWTITNALHYYIIPPDVGNVMSLTHLVMEVMIDHFEEIRSVAGLNHIFESDKKA